MAERTDQFFTVVCRLTDMAAARSTLEPLFAAFRGDEQLPGIEVTGVSLEDEMSKVDRLDQGLSLGS